ncbi:uncharacterized protein PAC_13216 [Phialocephala subalpina]|uniref:Uncharacterized protein n=1 Tax=Phialocephala subalpina TaxID=576137 RepID=A0A1L7XE49_9HELO|nr:uncharacterized protein PAC_13216 [Phialocephala subalpina]
MEVTVIQRNGEGIRPYPKLWVISSEKMAEEVVNNFDHVLTDKNAVAKLNNQRGQIVRRRLDRPGDIKKKMPKAP